MGATSRIARPKWPRRHPWLACIIITCAVVGCAALLANAAWYEHHSQPRSAANSGQVQQQTIPTATLEAEVPYIEAAMYQHYWSTGDATVVCYPVPPGTGKFYCNVTGIANFAELASYTVTVPAGWQPGDPFGVSSGNGPVYEVGGLPLRPSARTPQPAR